MTEIIYKYRLEPVPRPSVRMPKGAKVIHVAAQGEDAYVWAWVTRRTTVMVDRYFRVIFTGEEVVNFEHYQKEGKYIGTFHTTDGFVGHVFID